MKLPGIKRILPLVLTVLLLPALLAVPAMADTTDSNWYNLLDYGTLNDSGNHYVHILSGDSFYYKMPYLGNVSRLDMLYRTTASISSIEVSRDNTNWYEAEIIPVGGGIYRLTFSGTLQGNREIRVRVNHGGTSTAYITILSFRYSPLSYDAYKVGYSYDVYDELTTQTGDVVAGSNNIVTLTKTADYGALTYRAAFIVDSWQKYDSLDICISSEIYRIDSINVKVGNISVPFTVNYLVGADSNMYSSFTVSADVSQINHNLTDDLQVVVTGIYATEVDQTIGCYYCTGYIELATPSIFPYWFTQINKWIATQTDGITSAIATWGQNIIDALGGSNDASQVENNISSAIGELEDVQSVMDGVSRPALDSINFDVSGMMDTAAVATYGNIFSTLIGNQYMTNFLLMAFILAAASFLLFGRR